MRIGIHMSYSSADGVVAQCRAAGVDEIFLGAASVPGFEERGHLTPEQLEPVADGLRARDIQVSGIIRRNCGLQGFNVFLKTIFFFFKGFKGTFGFCL